MTDGNFQNIITFDVTQPLSETQSFRVATRTQILTCYRSMHKYLTDLRRTTIITNDNTLRFGEFNQILATLLICMANSEPSHHSSYAHTFEAQLNGVDCLVKFDDLIKRLIVTPFQFLAAHAPSVYKLGRSRAIEFEFGRLHGLHLTGVGFIAFPFAKSDSKTDNAAFDKLLNTNEHIRRYYFDCKLW
jgi:hypothetical protein